MTLGAVIGDARPPSPPRGDAMKRESQIMDLDKLGKMCLMYRLQNTQS